MSVIGSVIEGEITTIAYGHEDLLRMVLKEAGIDRDAVETVDFRRKPMVVLSKIEPDGQWSVHFADMHTDPGALMRGDPDKIT